MSDNIYTYDSVNFHKTFIPEEEYNDNEQYELVIKNLKKDNVIFQIFSSFSDFFCIYIS